MCAVRACSTYSTSSTNNTSSANTTCTINTISRTRSTCSTRCISMTGIARGTGRTNSTSSFGNSTQGYCAFHNKPPPLEKVGEGRENREGWRRLEKINYYSATNTANTTSTTKGAFRWLPAAGG